MKLAFDCERMKYSHTGIFEYCHQLGQALKAGRDVTDQISYYLHPDLQQYFNKEDSFLDQNSFQKFIFPRHKQIDLWHTTYQLSSYIPTSKSIKRVLTIHDLNFLHEGKSSSKTEKYLKKHQKIIDLADHIVAISNFTKQDILKNLDTRNKPITVIYNGCAEGILSISEKPAYVVASPFLFALGTVNPKKNFHVLIPLLTGNDFELIIAGKIEPDYRDKIMQEAAAHQVADRVKVIGPVSEQEKLWYYKNCEAFLFPSIAEGFGIPPIEAMRFGKPTFLSKATSLPEIGGDAAYYFNTYDPADMKQVFEDGMNTYNRTQPAQQIINHTKQFNWDRSAEAYWKVYRETLNQ
ncbi:glycosyltransferase family 4 protein [Pedobacter sp. NJ-S-72]